MPLLIPSQDSEHLVLDRLNVVRLVLVRLVLLVQLGENLAKRLAVAQQVQRLGSLGGFQVPIQQAFQHDEAPALLLVLQPHLVEKLGIAELKVQVAAVCVYHRFVETAVRALQGTALRVAAVSTLFMSASNELGEFRGGLVARFIGPVAAVVYGGVAGLVVTGVWAKLFPALRTADRLE